MSFGAMDIKLRPLKDILVSKIDFDNVIRHDQLKKEIHVVQILGYYTGLPG